MLKLSIIIPAYNVAPWIETTIQSICHSEGIDLSMVEVVVVNDGSKDNTAQVVEAFIEAQPEMNIQLIQQENQGVSAARNNGLKEAKGEYVWFVDGDDMLTPFAVRNVFDIMVQYPGVDVIKTGKPRTFFEEQGTKNMTEVHGTPIPCVPTELFYEQYSGLYICHVRHIWRTELLVQNSLEYPVGITTNEDFVFTIQSTLKAKTAVDAPWLNAYLVRKRQGSATDGRKNPEKFKNHVLSAQKALQIILGSTFGNESEVPIGEGEGRGRVRNLMIAMNITHLMDPLPLSFVRKSMRTLEEMGAYPFTPEQDHSRLLRFVLQHKWAIYAVSQYRRIKYILNKR